MRKSEKDERKHEEDTKNQMSQKHDLVEIILVELSLEPFEKSHRRQVSGVGTEQGK